jgi:predicted aspartyl protease
MGSLREFLKTKGYLKIPLTLTSTNHLELTARINGTPGRFILDTGASSTCIGIDKGAYFGLISEESEIMAAGAGATNMATMVSFKNEIAMGSWVRKRQQVVLFDLVHVNHALIQHESLAVDGIIGADLLKKAKAIIDYTTPCLYMKK